MQATSQQQFLQQTMSQGTWNPEMEEDLFWAAAFAIIASYAQMRLVSERVARKMNADSHTQSGVVLGISRRCACNWYRAVQDSLGIVDGVGLPWLTYTPTPSARTSMNAMCRNCTARVCLEMHCSGSLRFQCLRKMDEACIREPWKKKKRISHMAVEVFEFGLKLPATIATFRAGRRGHETASEAKAPL